MAKVKMKVATGWNGKKINPGDMLEIPLMLAERWVHDGICDIVGRQVVQKYEPKAIKPRSKKRGGGVK
jgi:hypothetical protein